MAKNSFDDVVLFSGTAHPALAFAVAAELGLSLAPCAVDRFPDGETAVSLQEPVRRRDVFVIQPLSPPVNEHLFELLAFADAARRAAAARVTAVIPYMGYSRADKRHGRREPIAGRLVADLLQAAGIDHVVTLDLHTPQLEGFFRIPVDELSAVPALAGALESLNMGPDVVVVAPDAGAVKLATKYAHRLDAPVAVVHKRRKSGTETEVTHVAGDVQGKHCVIVDDMITTGGTVLRAVDALRRAGALSPVTVAATHGLFVGDAPVALSIPSVGAILSTDTVPGQPVHWDRLRTVSIASLLAGALQRTLEHRSVRDLYQ